MLVRKLTLTYCIVRPDGKSCSTSQGFHYRDGTRKNERRSSPIDDLVQLQFVGRKAKILEKFLDDEQDALQLQ